MKINISIEDKPICTIDAEIDYKKAIEAGENISNQEFNELFALSVISSLVEQAKHNQEAAILYTVIRGYAAMKWDEKVKEGIPDTQEDFDKFFNELVTSDISIIPSVDK